MHKSVTNPHPDDKHITRQEARQLFQALDKPEFSGLMDGYINEISDPNNVKETNQFLKESEERKDLPPNVKLAKPTPGFCIRSEKYNIKRPATRQKVFINICSYSEIQEPKCEDGHMWSLPHLLNKGRHDQDKNKKICTTFDVVFNPKAIQLAKENLAFKKFVCDTAINGINNQLLSKTEEKISNDFIVKTKFDYKGLEVSYINVHTLNKGEMDDRKEPNEFHKTEIMKEVEKIKNENKEKEKNDEEEDKVYDQPDVGDQINEDIKLQKKIDVDNKTPIYKIKYSNNFDLNNYFYKPEGITEEENYSKMVIEIETPKMASVAEAELEIDVKKLKFSYKDIYSLNIELPIEIKKESVGAKFDKTKKLLSISAEINRKKVDIPKSKEDENIEYVKDEQELKEIEKEKKRKEEERKKEEEEKRKEEEEKRKEEERKKEEEEKKRKEAEEKEKLSKIKEEEKSKKEEVFIKGKKNENSKQDLPLKEVQYKINENQEEEKNGREGKKLIEELPQKEESKNNMKKEEHQALTNSKPRDEDDQLPSSTGLQLRLPREDDTKTPLVFLSFNSDWVYEVE